MLPEEALQADPATIRQRLPIPFVMEKYDELPAAESAGRLHYFSPFRHDSNPSLDVFMKDGEWRFGDFGEGSQGSAIDLIKRFDSSSDGEAINRARFLMAEFVQSDWAGPTITDQTERLDPAQLQVLLDTIDAKATAVAVSALKLELFHGNNHPALDDMDAEWLIDRWGVVAHPEGGVLIPYRDADGQPIGAKHRHGNVKMNLSGSRLELYGREKITDDVTPLIFCEGETDTWAMDLVHGAHYFVLGTSAGRRPERMLDGISVEGRLVLLAFDGDPAGRKAASLWAVELTGRGASVRAIPVPENKDISSLTTDRIETLISRAKPFGVKPEGIDSRGDQYIRPALSERGTDKQLSDWRFEVSRVLSDEQGATAYEGVLHPHGRVEILSPEDLLDARRLVTWCSKRGVHWLGSNADAQSLGMLLTHESTLAPAGRMTHVIGLHDGDYVLPDACLGQEHWVWSPGPGSLESLRERIISTQAPAVESIVALLAAASPEVTHPMLAWFAAAPLRPLFDRFPVLSVSGGSGSGKTTMTEAFMHAFAGSDLTLNLTSTTPFAVTALMSATNAVPVWFDEYRPGARTDAKTQLDQLLRDAYTGQRSARGQVKGNDLVLVETPTLVPIVVSGEDNFTETSHTDRMVLLRLTKGTQGALPDIDGTFTYEYLSWLQTNHYTTEAPTLVLDERYGHLPDRQQYNLAVLEFGWRLVGQFIEEHRQDWEWPDPDFSMVAAEGGAAASTDPTWDTVLWAYESGMEDCVWTDETVPGHLLVHPDSLLAAVRKAGVHKLPYDNVRGMYRLMEEQHQGTRHRVSKTSYDGVRRNVRVVAIPYEEG